MQRSKMGIDEQERIHKFYLKECEPYQQVLSALLEKKSVSALKDLNSGNVTVISSEDTEVEGWLRGRLVEIKEKYDKRLSQ